MNFSFDFLKPREAGKSLREISAAASRGERKLSGRKRTRGDGRTDKEGREAKT